MSADFGHGGGLEALDTSGTLSRLRASADAGNASSGLEYVDKAFTVFRGVMIGLFVLLFVAALMGIISGGFLLVAADNDMEGHDAWKGRARAMGGADIAIMFIFLAFGSYALYILLRYEKAMSYMLHRLQGNVGLVPMVKTAQQHLQMTNTEQMRQLPQSMGYPAALPTGSTHYGMVASAPMASSAVQGQAPTVIAPTETAAFQFD